MSNIKKKINHSNANESCSTKYLSPIKQEKKINFNVAFDDSSSSDSEYDCDGDELTTYSYLMFSDELPIFTIQSVSPSGESLSSIDDTDENNSIVDFSASPIDSSYSNGCENLNICDPSNERISLEDIHDKIGLSSLILNDHDLSDAANKRMPLETIHEGVFLETPPKVHKIYNSTLNRNGIKRPQQKKSITHNCNINEETEKENFLKDFGELHLSSEV